MAMTPNGYGGNKNTQTIPTVFIKILIMLNKGIMNVFILFRCNIIVKDKLL